MKRALTGILALPLLLTSACSSPEEPRETIQVFAAASLTESFTEIGERFLEETGTQVSFNFAGSADLVAQLEQGASADVFASADENNMASIQEANLVSADPVIFASNTLTIVTPPTNPADITDLTDLAREDVITVICAPQAPCGAATEEVTTNADIDLSPASEESAVTDVLGKVRAGEVDAGLVYVTDASTAGEDVQRIDFAESDAVVNRYPIASLKASENAEAAEEFIAYVEGEQGQEVLGEAGFGPP